jgi:hypothetical protein
MWQIVIISLNVDCIWAGMSTFKETITICHILHVASWWWAVCEPEACKTKTQNKLMNWCTVLVIVRIQLVHILGPFVPSSGSTKVGTKELLFYTTVCSVGPITCLSLVCWNIIVILIKLSAFFVANHSNWIIMGGMKNVKYTRLFS